MDSRETLRKAAKEAASYLEDMNDGTTPYAERLAAKLRAALAEPESDTPLRSSTATETPGE